MNDIDKIEICCSMCVKNALEKGDGTLNCIDKYNAGKCPAGEVFSEKMTPQQECCMECWAGEHGADLSPFFAFVANGGRSLFCVKKEQKIKKEDCEARVLVVMKGGK